MKIVCNKCQYEWDYKGKLMNATCPNCLYKQGVEYMVREDQEKVGGKENGDGDI